MSQPRPSPVPRPRIRLASALALVALLAACAGAIDEPLAQPVHGAWPPPWQDSPRPAPDDDGWPRFAPPSASHCRRAPGLREVAGLEQGVQRSGARRVPDAAEPAPALAEHEGSAKSGATTATTAAVAPRHAVPGAAPGAAAERPFDGPSERWSERSSAAPLTLPRSDTLRRERPARETVTAGVIDDNADFGEYLAYRERHAGLAVHERDIAERYLVEVSDAAGRPVHDAEIAVQRSGVAAPVAWARTDTAGRVWLHPRVFLGEAGGDERVDPGIASRWPQPPGERRLGVAARKGGWQAQATLVRGERQALQLRLAGAPQGQRPRLDLVFMVDATGSMGDEIAKLKSSMQTMAQQIAQLPGQPDICWGLVAYRDRGDAFITRTQDFSDELGAFQQALARVQAGGGGDTPEALNEALHEVVHGLSWRSDAVRLVVMVGDAPPHLDYGGPQYDVDMQAALAKGIKLFAVGASGLDAAGEYVFRQLAQYTAGRFVFLTYRDAADPGSGPGSQTVHDVRNYSVQTLDRLVLRLVGDELKPLARSARG